jgi:hypothetical protein
MITSKLPEQPLLPELNPAAKSTAASSQNPTVAKKANAVKKNPTESVVIHKQYFEVFNSQPAYSKVNMLAATVRGADESMQKIDEQVEQMKDQLLQHVKHYPPFGQDSQERVKLMKLFSSFRKQIDQLTIPADNYGAMKIMADPSSTGDAGDWEIEMDVQGNRMTIHSQQVHSGPDGLNIPDLPDSASDEDIYTAIQNLETAHNTLGQRRSELASNFEHILDQTHFWE